MNGTEPLTLNPSAPLASAKTFIGLQYMDNGQRTLHHQNDTFHQWTGSHYQEVHKEEMHALLYTFLDGALRIKDGKLVPFNPDKTKIANVLEATKAQAQIPMTVRAPVWLDNRKAPNAADLLACANGLLHLPTREILPHSPALFTTNALDFAYDLDAPKPCGWLAFLNSIWPTDPDAIATLQEIFGLLLTGNTRHQKAFLIVGPKRSGKGTIARILSQLLGPANVCGPTLNSLAQNFGLAPMIGKRLAIISDARLSGGADQQTIAERILTITGEDALSIDRKYREVWNGKLDTRLLIMTNELPRLSDASGALASRFIILTMQNSFYGKEDHGLIERLTDELPGILCWAIEGLERLSARGYFVPPPSAGVAQQELEDLGSPIGAFLRDRCEIGGALACQCDELFEVWKTWCSEQGRDHCGTKQTFGRDLRAALPAITTTQPRSNDRQRIRYYQGLGLIR